MNFNYAIILTGGIATGKSAVSGILQDCGFGVIDLDKINHGLLKTHSKEIASLFGKEYLVDGEINRRALGKLVFGDLKKRKILEGYLHPLIKQEAKKQAIKLEKLKKLYFIDNPLYFEMGGFLDIKEVLLVYAPTKIQLQRLMKRNSFIKEEAQKRIDSQMYIEDKKLLASYVIDNSKDTKHLKAEVEKMLTHIKEKYAHIKI